MANTSETDHSLRDATADALAESRKMALRRIRLAVVIGLVAPCFEIGSWVYYAIGHINRVAVHPMADAEIYAIVIGRFTDGLIEEGAKLIATFVAGFWLAYPVFTFASGLVRRALCAYVPKSQWRLASESALWPLPYAATGGVITWMVYEHVFPYGIPNDIVCGTVGHLLGVWCYLTLFVSWFQVAKAARKPDVS